MIEQDTVKLLRECDAGVKMGTKSLDEVMRYAHSEQMISKLNACKDEHNKLDDEIRRALHRFGDEGKEPNPMASAMSWIKTEVKLAVHESDAVIADLMTEGCNMGVKSLSKYLNQYEAADESAKNVAKKLIKIEENLAKDMRTFL